MTPQIGDRFIINWKKIRQAYRIKVCKFPDLEFSISSFSKSGLSVYYKDERTNKKCSCNHCVSDRQICSIGVADIIITQSKISFERDRKLKKLGI